MDAPGVSGDGIYLATFRHQLPPSVSNGKPGSGVKGQGSGLRLDNGLGYHGYGDGNSVAISHSVMGLVGSYTPEAPLHYDLYVNRDAWGRRKRFRPPLFQLHSEGPMRMLWGVPWLSLFSSVTKTFQADSRPLPLREEDEDDEVQEREEKRRPEQPDLMYAPPQGAETALDHQSCWSILAGANISGDIKENLYALIDFFGKGSGRHAEPLRGSVLTYIIAFCFTLIDEAKQTNKTDFCQQTLLAQYQDVTD
ncbi:unnamed protein product [Arctogadus glacialis]